MQDMTQYIKELEQHVTWKIFYRKSVTGAHILPIIWDFKVKHFPDDRLWRLKSILCARDDIKWRKYITLKSMPLLYLGIQSDSY